MQASNHATLWSSANKRSTLQSYSLSFIGRGISANRKSTVGILPLNRSQPSQKGFALTTTQKNSSAWKINNLTVRWSGLIFLISHWSSGLPEAWLPDGECRGEVLWFTLGFIFKYGIVSLLNLTSRSTESLISYESPNFMIISTITHNLKSTENQRSVCFSLG